MISYKNKYIQEVEETLTLLSLNSNKQKTVKLKKYIGTQYHVHGLTSAMQVGVYKNGFDFIKNNIEEDIEIFNVIYHQCNSFEGKNLAFIFLDKNHKHIPINIQLQILPLWVEKVDIWAHSDSLSKYLTRLLEHKTTHKELLTILKTWNSSSNLWKRRQSLISLYYYARTKTEFINYEISEKLISNLLLDNEYYVQKAVGWALRESFNVYPKQTFEFIKQNIKSISSVAFTTCIEKMNGTQKLILKSKRKK
jgi:3-methyladenine DNA glycosylase AlkD